MNNRKKRWQYGMGGLFLVITFICVRLGLESQGWGPWSHRMGMITVEVDRPVSSELENKLRSNLRDVESVTLISFRNGVIRVHVRKRATPQVLEVIREHGLKIESHKFH